MSFQSFHFLAFFLGLVTLNWLLRDRPGLRKNLLLVASYYFYMAWDWRFSALLAGLTLVNFVVGQRIHRAADDRVRKLWLVVSLVYCLGTLAFFKYAGFFVMEMASLMAAMGFTTDTATLHVILPLGISFFTFQSLSYVLDVYRRQERECTDLRDFALFVAFFPTVLAGPITRARQLLPQLAAAKPPLYGQMEEGLALMLRGFVKKVFFADVLATHIVGPAFAAPADFSSAFLLLGLYAYTFQIYMDVSAYTDIARGAAQMCGFQLPRNFDRPYVAATVSNFWQRWHISMSSFFRDYLYFGLGGSQRGNVYLNLMLTFLAIGVWHGAGWNFAVYGLIHGAAVCVERWRRERRRARGLPPEVEGGWPWFAGVFVTFHVVVFSRVLFRAPDLESAGEYMRQLFLSGSEAAPLSLQALFTLTAAAALHWVFPHVGSASVTMFARQRAWLQAVVLVGFTYVMMAMSIGTAPFVYFQF